MLIKKFIIIRIATQSFYDFLNKIPINTVNEICKNIGNCLRVVCSAVDADSHLSVIRGLLCGIAENCIFKCLRHFIVLHIAFCITAFYNHFVKGFPIFLAVNPDSNLQISGGYIGSVVICGGFLG